MPRAAIIVLGLSVAVTALFAQNVPVQSSADRKVITRIAPAYPELAKRMHLQGVVKVEAIVRPNGTVKSTRVLGGNPVLVNSAMDAINKWKFEPASSETIELVQLTFAPE